MIKGNHTIKVGGQFQDAYTKTRRDRSRSDLSFYYYGFYYCASDGSCNANLGSESQANPVAALNELLLGLAGGSGRSFGVTNRPIFQRSVGLYLPNSSKPNPNFTLTA